MGKNLEQVLHMAGGDGETSYATNSRLQEKALLRTKLIVEEAVREVCNAALPAESLVVADLGCSSGPNTFLAISHVIEAIGRHCRRLGCNPPEVLCLLNDLPGNDFDAIFHYSTSFEKKMKEEKGEEQVPYNIVGVIGSFYRRLFPSHSVHFFHSSYSIMWLSQVPRGVDTEKGVPLNKGNIYISKTSPSRVIESYYRQFKSDFSTFLKLRCKELVFGGRMVLTFLGRKTSDAPSSEYSCLWGLFSDALNAMVLQGHLRQEKVDSFNLPLYTPSMQEVKEILSNEESLALEKQHIFDSNWDPFDDDSDDTTFDNWKSGENAAKCLRAVVESMLVEQFGDAIMDDLFSRFARNVAMHLLREKTKYVIFVIVLSRL